MCGELVGRFAQSGEISCSFPVATQLSDNPDTRKSLLYFPRFSCAWPGGPTEFETWCCSAVGTQKEKCGLEVPANLLILFPLLSPLPFLLSGIVPTQHLSISEGEVNSIITEPGGVCPSDQLPRRPAAHELQLGYPQLLSASSTPALLLFAQ